MTKKRRRVDFIGQLDKHLKEPGPDRIIASLFAHTNKDSITAERRVLHVALLRLKSDKRFKPLLKEFVFSEDEPYPFSRLFESTLPRLALVGYISVPNPEYNKIVISEQTRQTIKKDEKSWFSPNTLSLIDEMGKRLAELISDREEELKRRT